MLLQQWKYELSLLYQNAKILTRYVTCKCKTQKYILKNIRSKQDANTLDIIKTCSIYAVIKNKGIEI